MKKRQYSYLFLTQGAGGALGKKESAGKGGLVPCGGAPLPLRRGAAVARGLLVAAAVAAAAAATIAAATVAAAAGAGVVVAPNRTDVGTRAGREEG